MTLLDRHQELLDASAISPEVAEARGYFSAEKRTELADLGFERYQQIVPALVLPSHGVDGAIVNYQSRPDRPRIDSKRSREVKYETVAGSSLRPDVPPVCRPRIGSITSSLWVTEGIRKADALASAGQVVVGLLGVWSFKTDDWDRVALDGRHVYVVFDNDVMIKPEVHGALERLGKLLAAKGAIVHFVYLPQDDGKIGVDDYLAAGHTLDELYALAEDELRPLPAAGKVHGPVAWPAMPLLGAVGNLLRRFVRFPSEHEPVALALYVLHTWALGAAVATPYLLIISPEKRSGKTRLLEAVELVVREPLRAASITAAGVFQAIEAWTPTLLVDEVDAVFRARSEQAEALRAVLNAGNRRGSYVVRGSQDGKPVRFTTFCPKALAGINTGRLPDTIRDRSIVIAMERKLADESVSDLFPGDLEGALATLRPRLEDWATENLEALAAYRRSARIWELDDRLQEAWDPLLAIAALAGGDWPQRARDAAIALAKGAADAADQEHGHLLLVALRGIFAKNGDTLASKAICKALNANEELPFGAYRDGVGIDPRALARLLKGYKVKPKVIRIGAETPRGYERDQFAVLWKRYGEDETHAHSEPPPGSATSATSATSKPQSQADVADVADVALGNGHPRDARQLDPEEEVAREQMRRELTEGWPS